MTAETAHGILRALLLEPVVGDFRARQASVVSGILIIFGITWLRLPWMAVRGRANLLRTGLVWVAMTVAFELLLGYSLGLSAERILADYNLARGGLMPLGLAGMALSPWIAAKIRGTAT
jgi:hypothetical protein